MLLELKLKNVGINAEQSLEFGNRINVLTGDNGLGKSFLLDIVWWSLTRTWIHNINPNTDGGYIAKPLNIKEKAEISFSIKGSTTDKKRTYSANYFPENEAWQGKPGRPINPGLVIYAMADGSFGLWDPHRNYWKQDKNTDVPAKIPAYVFTQKEIWFGKQSDDKQYVFMGLMTDWVNWQMGQTQEFKHLQDVLSTLSTNQEPLKIGKLGRISLDDERQFPTITMPYGQDVLLPHASSAIKKIVTLAYLLVYSWQKHLENAELLGKEPTNQITFIFDEMEAHLHPKWQQKIVPAILKVMENLNSEAKTQLFTATHSPLVMASLESFFNNEQDKWFDLDLENQKIVLNNRPFKHTGGADDWLISQAFDLKSSRAPEIQQLIDEANNFFNPNREKEPTLDEVEAMRLKLVKVLSGTDEFLVIWRFMCEKKGWLIRS